jgi:hypothetical protein
MTNKKIPAAITTVSLSSKIGTVTIRKKQTIKRMIKPKKIRNTFSILLPSFNTQAQWLITSLFYGEVRVQGPAAKQWF